MSTSFIKMAERFFGVGNGTKDKYTAVDIHLSIYKWQLPLIPLSVRLYSPCCQKPSHWQKITHQHIAKVAKWYCMFAKRDKKAEMAMYLIYPYGINSLATGRRESNFKCAISEHILRIKFLSTPCDIAPR